MVKLIMYKESEESPEHKGEGKILDAVEWRDQFGIVPGTINGYYFDQVRITEVDRERFTEVLNYTHRIWDDSVKIGIRYFCAKIPLITAIKESGYILIRNDGWSLACREEAFEEAFHLYEKSWDRIYRVASES